MTDAPYRSVSGSSIPPAEPTETLPRGTTVGRYVIASVIGHGGMGVVYSAFDAQLDRKLAIKVIRDDRLRKTPEISSRLLREAQAMARLTHPNVVSIYDVGTYGERVFLAMEYVEGCTLREWTRRDPPWRARLDVLLSAGEGLAAAHEAGVVHRDFKPDNVLIGNDKRVLVTDFGLAREIDTTSALPLPVPPDQLPAVATGAHSIVPGGSEPPPDSSLSPAEGDPDDASLARAGAALTRAGNILGTVGYMAPEQAYGKNTTFATDQFSYAVTAYFILYGQLPFPGDRVRSYLRSIYRAKLEPPRDSEVPTWVHRVLVRGMSRKPEERFASMEELLGALRNDPRAALRRRMWAALLVLSFVAIALVSWRTVLGRSQLCAVPAGEWAGIWDDGVTEEVRRAFATADAERGPVIFDRARVGIGSYVSQWNAMQVESCDATRVRKTQAEDVYRLRSDCLFRRKEELASVTRLMRKADRDVVGNGVALAYGLDSISWCGDIVALRNSSGLPDDPDKRAKVQVLRGRVADLQSLFSAGKYKQLIPEASQIAELARELGDASTVAQGLYFAGHASVRLGDLQGARKFLFDSVFSAVEAGDNATAARSAMGISYILGAKERSTVNGRYWLSLAAAFVKRMGGNAEYTAWLTDTEGSIVADGEGDAERANGLQELAYASYKQTFGLIHPRTQLSLMNLALVHAQLGHFEKARGLFQEAADVADSLYGPSSVEAFQIAAELGDCDTQLGAVARGEDELLRGLAGEEASNDQLSSTEALGWLVRNAVLRGDLKGALEFAARAQRSLEKINSLPSLVPGVLLPSASALLLARKPEEALPLCDRVLAQQEASGPIPEEKLYPWDALTCKAEALLALGRTAEAASYLERSLRIHRRVSLGDYARAEFALARALAAEHKDAVRVLELAHRAKEEFVKFPFLARELADVNLFLAKRDMGGGAH